MRCISRFYNAILLSGICMVLLGSCKNNQDKVYDDPYAGGKPPLGVRMSTDFPSPRLGDPGTVVTYKATGLVPYKSKLKFFINGEVAEVVAVDSVSIQVKVPENASTGIGYVTVDDKIVFGPVFRVNGKLTQDNTFKALVGSNGNISQVMPLPDGRMILIGGFNNYENKGSVKPLNRIVLVSKDGELDRSLQVGDALPTGYLNNISTLPNGKMVISGSFSTYDIHRGEVSNITVLNSNGTIDSMVVRTFLDQDTVPAFNGGVDGSIQRAFVHGSTITAAGNFNFYLQRVYGKSDYRRKRDSLVTDSVRIKSVVRFFADGSLDSSFNYNFLLHRSNDGPNGPVNDAFMQEDGKLILVGRFTRYNNESVNYIVRLNTDGSIDRTFKVGIGADNYISSLTYNEAKRKFTLSGGFTSFDGKVQNGLAILNEDGSLDPVFKGATKNNDDTYYYAKQLSNGMVLVSGYFKNYGGVHRGQLMLLDGTGALAKGYNTTGDMDGIVTGVYETKNFAGQLQLLITGSFGKFDEQPLGNISRLLVK
ncbi:DUF5008 domain-containing protein [Chitinophaga arvensicola]|uniref:DUF5008 domain-containing protein n=1 Tax=Chitinophaga arvensicola TaxID=29529 RepID=A0A1I0SBX1_9BACT|nr:DUF5008 domain-containing protein [Chitinophaga arvensicola]SEW52981.1 protein of unknown function [Chitinophaga arvensicola]